MNETGADVSARRSLGTRPDRRAQLPWTEADFRILSIDGGGIRGILPAAVLAECERRFLDGASAAPYFDLVAGTSTGGIIALGLASGMTAQRILNHYLYRGDGIFPRVARRRRVVYPLQGCWRFAKNLFVARYDGAALADLLDDILGERRFGDASVRLVIPTFDRNEEVNVFKTPHHPDYRLDWKEKMTTVARATSAAPTYLPLFALGARRFGDGGIWANDPVMLGLVDALVCHDVNRHDVRILSLGCGSERGKISDRQVSRGGRWVWRTAVETAMRLASQNALGQAGLLVGRERLLRVDHVFGDDPIKLDDHERAAAELPRIAVDLVDRHEACLARFFDHGRTRFRPFHGGTCWT